MLKKITCIDCPKGCPLEIEVENGRVVNITGHQCPKGEEYAKQEIESPTRILTSTVLAEGLDLKMVPVRTEKPIPKSKILEGMEEIKKLRLSKPVKVGDAVVKDFLGLGVNLISTRNAFSKS